MKRKNRKFLAAIFLGLMLMLGLSATASAASYKDQIVKKNGKQYYYNNAGKLVKGKYGYKIKNKYYRIDDKGVLTRVSKVEGLAGIQLNPYYGKNSKSTTLWKAFQWSAKLPYVANSTKVPAGQTKAEYFGLYGFQRKRGDCNVQAATFYWMAKVLGYKGSFVQGYVPQAVDKNGKPTKFGAHAWVTLKQSKTTYVYDPNFSGYCYRNNIIKGLKSGYKFKYGAKSTYRYFNSKKEEIK